MLKCRNISSLEVERKVWILFKFKKNRRTYETKEEYEALRWPKHFKQLGHHFKKHYQWWVIGGACFGFICGGIFYLNHQPQFEPDESLTVEVSDGFPINQSQPLPTLSIEWSQNHSSRSKDSFLIQLEKESYEIPYQDYRWSRSIPFKGESLRLVLNNKKSVNLLNPNTLKEKQTIVLKEEQANQYLLTHTIDLDSKLQENLHEITYDLINQEGKIISTLFPSSIETEGEQTIISSLIETPLEGEVLLFVRINVWIDQVQYHLLISPFIEIDHFKSLNNDLSSGVLNQKAEHLTLESHHFFAESLHLKVKESEDIITYQLISPYKKGEPINYYDEANKGIRLKDLMVGDYLLYLNEKPIYSSADLTETWYTLPREGSRKKITLSPVFGLLTIRVEETKELPDSVYDLVIDAGHGGEDPGANSYGLTEAQETLKISLYLKEQFEKHGLKVKLTRETDEDPAQLSIFDYEKAPYVENGRVDQVYRYQAKYTISNHLNALKGETEGLEIYSSIVTDDKWSRSILNRFNEINRLISDSPQNQYRVSEGSYKRYYACPSGKVCLNPYIDYLYMIRETGGALTHPVSLTEVSPVFSTIPSYGSESILIEYAYLDHQTDHNQWLTNWEEWADAVVEGTLNYLKIKP